MELDVRILKVQQMIATSSAIMVILGKGNPKIILDANLIEAAHNVLLKKRECPEWVF